MIVLLEWWCISFEAIVVQSNNHIMVDLANLVSWVGLVNKEDVSHSFFLYDWILGNYFCNVLYKCRILREGLSN